MRYNWIEVTDKEGWHKAFPLEEKIVRIGSDTGNDIQVICRQDKTISWRIQLIPRTTDMSQYRLVNLGYTDILLGASGARSLAPHPRTRLDDDKQEEYFADIMNGEHIRVGGDSLTLVLHCEETTSGIGDGVSHTDTRFESSRVRGTSKNIGLGLFLPRSQLHLDHVVDGFVTVRNLGKEPSVKFNLTVEGLDSDCYKIGAGPVLFPGPEGKVFFHLLYPQRLDLEPGERQLRIYATASEYPGERAVVFETIYIPPFYEHELDFAEDNKEIKTEGNS